MGIRGIESFLRKCGNCISDVRINELIENEEEDNVIVVDGNQFFESYIYERFDWIHLGIKQLMEVIHQFVRAFMDIKIRLVFIFTHSCPVDALKRPYWCDRRTSNVQFYQQNLLPPLSPEEIPRHFGDRFEYIKYFVIYYLKYIEQCDVLFGAWKNRIKLLIEYTIKTRALALLAQNSYLMFCSHTPRYLSVNDLNLEEMKTREYSVIELERFLNLERLHFPLLATILGENSLAFCTQHPTQIARDKIFLELKKLKGRSYIEKVANYIGANLIRGRQVQEFILQDFPDYGELILSSYREYLSQFTIECERDLKDILEEEELQNFDVDVWNMLTSTVVYGSLHDVVFHKTFQQYTLPEDFKSLPASGLVFKSLRVKMYGILFHDIVEQGGQIEIEEWYADNYVMPQEPQRVAPAPIDPRLHCGLLNLWNMPTNIGRQKLQLFCSAISVNLDMNLIINLHPRLVIPTVTLYYLKNEMPKFHASSYRFLEPWEINVFIAVAVLLPSTTANDILQLDVSNCCARSVQLCAFFVCGCYYMHMLGQVCGYPVNAVDMLIFNYFDGALFHFLYKEAKNHGYNNMVTNQVRDQITQVQNILNLK